MSRGMRLWSVVVHGEDNYCRRRVVQASTSNDARLMAFVLDGGWGPEEMDEDAIESAYMWTDEPKPWEPAKETSSKEGDS